MSPLRGYISSYPPRLRQYGNALLTPIAPPPQAGPPPRTKRGTAAINYAEDGFDDDDLDDSEGHRRPTGLRSLRREDSVVFEGGGGGGGAGGAGGGGLGGGGGAGNQAGNKLSVSAGKLGKEIDGPVEIQGIFRDWMIKRMVRPA